MKYIKLFEEYNLEKEVKVGNYEIFKSDIIDYIESISETSKYAAFARSTFYSLVPYKEGYIQVRVADHFFNMYNIHLGRNILWDSVQDLPKYNKYKNIYGFLSINILDANTDYHQDVRGYRKSFISRRNVTKFPSLIEVIKYDIKNHNLDKIHYKLDIQDALNDIKAEIDKALSSKIFDDKDKKGNYLEYFY